MQWAFFIILLCVHVQEGQLSISSKWNGLVIEYACLQLSLVLFNCLTNLLFQLILPTILSIVTLKNFGQSTWCEMENHSGFYYHIPDYWWGSLSFQILTRYLKLFWELSGTSLIHLQLIFLKALKTSLYILDTNFSTGYCKYHLPIQVFLHYYYDAFG